MAIVEHWADRADVVLRRVEDAVDHVIGICFKTGPPCRIGVELEWTVHRAGAPQAHLDAATLRAALGPYAPASLSRAKTTTALPAGGVVTVEPGGQLEISSAPATSLPELHAANAVDIGHLTERLTEADLILGSSGLDPHRAPRRLLHTPRYVAMQRMFDTHGPHGLTMMCSTAGLQVCLDAGSADRLASRWAALHDVGPALLAAFATAGRHAGRDTGWASGRMAAWFGIDSARTRPVGPAVDPAQAWARYAVTAPLLCVRRHDGPWDVPPGVTFADWIRGALPQPPTVDDLDYHLGTLFPPVRPRGYLEVRYLDAQPGGEWIAPAAVLASLFADDAVTDAARAVAAPAADRWLPAARNGLSDPTVAAAATGVLELACRGLERTGLARPERDLVTDIVDRRLHSAGINSAGINSAGINSAGINSAGRHGAGIPRTGKRR